LQRDNHENYVIVWHENAFGVRDGCKEVSRSHKKHGFTLR